ncbi:MAG: zinc ribbon domain-containing protein [Dehalococcoidia bacterium]|nr:zinc ribbon domain-containing protein [Dehalococcoidia bacterium]
MTEQSPMPQATYERIPISPRLEEVAVQIRKGQAPNSGRFCGNCYTPLAADRDGCGYCGASVRERPPVERVPAPVIAIVRAKRSRESWIVNGFAYIGLLIGTAITIWLFVVLPGLWKIAAFAMMLLGTRGFAAILGGWLGDMLGYRSAAGVTRRRWEAYLAQRDGAGH